MEKSDIIKSLKQAKSDSKKRNFKQTVEYVVTLTGVDLKKNENKIDAFVQLHYTVGKDYKVCALVGPELQDSAKESMDMVIVTDDFDEYAQDKRKTRKLAATYDFFVGQANVMPRIAQAFGKVLGSRGKMPNPKAGCIVPPNANLQPLYDKLQKTLHIQAKTSPVVQCPVGKEDMDEEKVVDNIMSVHNTLLARLPNGKHNIKSAYIKLTMGKPVKVI
jgi:large subunit ribosomal protein L1